MQTPNHRNKEHNATGLDHVMLTVCAQYGATYVGFIDHPVCGGVYSAVRGSTVYRAYTIYYLVSMLRSTYVESFESSEAAVPMDDDLPAFDSVETSPMLDVDF